MNNSENLSQAAKQLETALALEQKQREALSKLNRNLALGLGINSIILSGLATIFGVLIAVNGSLPFAKVWQVLAPVSAATAGVLQGALLGYPVDKRAVFHRTLAAQASSLRTSLEVRTSLENIDIEYIQGVSDELNQIRIKGASEEPETIDKIATSTLEQIKETLGLIDQVKAQIGSINPNVLPTLDSGESEDPANDE